VPPAPSARPPMAPSRSLALAAVAAVLAAPEIAPALPRVRTMVDLRQQGIVRQGWDLSCGAAALGTLLTYDLGDPVTEPEIVQALLRGADPDRVRARGGFSLLDLKRYATARGHLAAGYGNLRLSHLAALGAAIVPTIDRAGPHFMIYRGQIDGRVVLADPAYGNRTMPREQFEAIWSPRVAFVVRRGGPAARVSDPGPGAVALVPPRIVRGGIGARP
jgi:uncharacterized protein